MSIYKKLSDARAQFHALQLKKSGHNKFAGYYYFELGDFLVPALSIFASVGIISVTSFDKEVASMKVINIEKPDDFIVFTSPFGGASLKGAHEIQNIGAVETYQRRYLWVTAMEIVEHDALDSGAGPEPKGPELDMSPKSRAVRIVNGVKAGDAASAAIAMAGWDEKLLNSVWAFLDAKTQDTLTANWPKD